MKYTIDEDIKKIIKAAVHGDEKRRKRKSKGTLTEFDKSADRAIVKAKNEMDLEGFDEEARQHIINKIYTSLLYNTPWENLGDTYCCRRLFYEYRRQFMYLVALNMGMVSKCG